MRLKGYFTVEAAFIFSFITLLIIGIIKLDFLLHDNLVNNTVKILGGLRYYQAAEFYYNPEAGKINVTKLVNSPVLKEDEDYLDKCVAEIEDNVSNYYEAKKIGEDNELSDTAIESVIEANDNAQIVRAGGKLVQVIGEE